MFACIHFQSHIETSRPQTVNLSLKKIAYQHWKTFDRCSRSRKISDTHRQCLNLFWKKNGLGVLHKWCFTVFNLLACALDSIVFIFWTFVIFFWFHYFIYSENGKIFILFFSFFLENRQSLKFFKDSFPTVFNHKCPARYIYGGRLYSQFLLRV